ncbi:MAG TPA: sigma-70 family RNA polymerase sigma factor [Jatrophihabitans sp.]|nr:sigma-70 family RNA polymerase sigma factor [Jatrophihabitans sp.]
MDAPSAPSADDQRAALLRLYDPALPQVYGYLLRRCGRREVAEELASETFLAAADAVRRDRPPRIDVAWLIGVARHKLADHWRRQAREERGLRVVATDPTGRPADDDPWDAHLDRMRATQTLTVLAPQHRLALTLRYVDDLPVAEVAAVLGRTLHATEALLVRARIAFRASYTSMDGEGDGHA